MLLAGVVGAVVLFAAAGGAVIGTQFAEDGNGARPGGGGTAVTSPPILVSDDPGSLTTAAINVPAAVAAMEPSIVAVSADVLRGRGQRARRGHRRRADRRW